MNRTIRPVSIGLLLGIIGLFFGIFWAMYITVNHEKIHEAFSKSAGAALRGKSAAQTAPAGHDQTPHGHDGPEAHVMDEKAAPAVKPADTHDHGKHDDPTAKAAHERLVRGHIHAMGLGILTISVSLVISMTGAPNALKTLASACLGVGSLFYPLAWIVMGYRTPSMGIEAAQESVFPIAALSIPLVLIGLFICLFYLLKGMAGRGENA